MRNVMGSVFAAAGLIGLVATSAMAENPACSSNDIICVDTSSATAGTGNPLTALTNGPLEVIRGIVAVGPKTQGSMPGIYAVFDGDEGVPNPLDGYLGLSTLDLKKTLGLVGSPEGNFNRAGGNDSIATLLGALPGAPSNMNAAVLSLEGLAPNLSFFQTGQIPETVPNLIELGHLSLPAIIK